MNKSRFIYFNIELKSEKENAEIRITDPDQYQSIVDAEWSIIYEKLDKCVESGIAIHESLCLKDHYTFIYYNRS